MYHFLLYRRIESRLGEPRRSGLLRPHRRYDMLVLPIKSRCALTVSNQLGRFRTSLAPLANLTSLQQPEILCKCNPRLMRALCDTMNYHTLNVGNMGNATIEQ